MTLSLTLIAGVIQSLSLVHPGIPMFSEHNYQAEDWLKDGSAVTVRAVRAADKPLLQQIMRLVSAECRYFRFFTAKKLLTDTELKYFTEIDFDTHIALLVMQTVDGVESPVAVGRYVSAAEVDGRTSAELALLVSEQYQRQGVGKLLFKHLAEIAVTKGVSEFVCYILPENRSMLSLLRGTEYGQVKREHQTHSMLVTVDLKQSA